jgi:hypothetical protein
MIRLARIPTGHSFGRDLFLGDAANPVSPDQKAQQLRSLIEGLPEGQKYRAQIDQCMAPWIEAKALRMQSGGWAKLKDMMAPTDALSCLEAIEARIPPPAPAPRPVQISEPVEQPKPDLLPVMAGVGVVGIAIALLSTIK